MRTDLSLLCVAIYRDSLILSGESCKSFVSALLSPFKAWVAGSNPAALTKIPGNSKDFLRGARHGPRRLGPPVLNLVMAESSSCYNHSLMFSAGKLTRLLLLLALSVSCGAVLSFAQSDAPSKSDNTQKQQAASGTDDAVLISGLKQALEISSTKAISQTGKRDGFLENEAIRILLPPRLQAIGKSMRMLGRGDEVDELEIAMNRAAEEATPQARPIFSAALKNAVFKDPRLIVDGTDSAATDYFRRSSSSDLTAAFTPIVHRTMEHLGVTKQYKRVLKSDPGGNAIANEFDLDQYVVEQTLDGIFNVMASEESMIRREPSAQNSELLKEVFGASK
jgi:Protein of unknown function (DUF4197)